MRRPDKSCRRTAERPNRRLALLAASNGQRGTLSALSKGDSQLTLMVRSNRCALPVRAAHTAGRSVAAKSRAGTGFISIFTAGVKQNLARSQCRRKPLEQRDGSRTGWIQEPRLLNRPREARDSAPSRSERAHLGTATGGQTGSRLAVCCVADWQSIINPPACRMPFGVTADCQSALQASLDPYWWECQDAPSPKCARGPPRWSAPI